MTIVCNSKSNFPKKNKAARGDSTASANSKPNDETPVRIHSSIFIVVRTASFAMDIKYSQTAALLDRIMQK